MNTQRPGVLLALTPITEHAIEHLLFGEQAPLTPAGSASEAHEIERLARERHARTVLLSPGLSGLTSGHCQRLRASGLRLVGLALDEHEQHQLQTLAVDAIITHDISPDALLEQIAEPSTIGEPAPSMTEREVSTNGRGGGVVLAVVGSKGAPGSSECACSLAALASRRWPTVLVDLDMLGSGFDVRLGADPHRGSLLGIARAATAGEQPLAELLDRWLVRHDGWPPVLLAPPDPDQALPELAQPGAIAATAGALRHHFGLAILDVGFLLGGEGELAPEARVHREALIAADAVLLVIGARDAHQRPGLKQLDLLLHQLAIPPGRLRIALNGIDGPGACSERALTETLLPRLAEHGLTADAWLAWDTKALERTGRTGSPLAVSRPKGRYGKVLSHLLDQIFLPTGSVQARKQRFVVPAQTPTVAEEEEEEEVALPWRR
jgi:hypothetical protein